MEKKSTTQLPRETTLDPSRVSPALAKLVEGAGALGVALPPGASERFQSYLEEIARWRGRLNLTSASSDTEVVLRHFLDSLVPLAVLRPARGCRLADVGSGAGFPGVPMKIARPDLEVVLIEASRKRCAFLEEVRASLNLPDLAVRWSRAEEMGHAEGFREAFGVVVSRATARTAVSVELTLPLVEVGGAAVLLKGPAVEQEIGEIAALVGAMGASVEACEVRSFPEPGRKTAALVLRKHAPTPQPYPRRGPALGRPV